MRRLREALFSSDAGSTEDAASAGDEDSRSRRMLGESRASGQSGSFRRSRDGLAWHISRVREEEEAVHVELKPWDGGEEPVESLSAETSSRLRFLAMEAVRSLRASATGRAGFLFACLVLYLLLGGMAFQWMEHQAREEEVMDVIEEAEEERAALLKSLWAETIAKSEGDWLQTAHQRLDLYENDLKEMFAKGVDLQDEDDDNPWTFLGSVFYCFTVVTTIGFGNIYPATTLGRLATVAYGLVGIPLCLIYLAEIGAWTTKQWKRLLAKKWPEVDAESGEFDFGLGMGVAVTMAYLFVGGVIFDFLEEDWDLIDGLYFSFVSFSTIGFGDLVPSSQGWMLALMLYSLSALSLVAACLTLIQGSLDAQLEKRKDQLNAMFARWREGRASAVSKKTDEPAEEEDEDANTSNYTWGQ